MRSKGEKLNWKPLKQVVPVKIDASTLKRETISSTHKRTGSKIVIQ